MQPFFLPFWICRVLRIYVLLLVYISSFQLFPNWTALFFSVKHSADAFSPYFMSRRINSMQSIHCTISSQSFVEFTVFRNCFEGQGVHHAASTRTLPDFNFQTVLWKLCRNPSRAAQFLTQSVYIVCDWEQHLCVSKLVSAAVHVQSSSFYLSLVGLPKSNEKS